MRHADTVDDFLLFEDQFTGFDLDQYLERPSKKYAANSTYTIRQIIQKVCELQAIFYRAIAKFDKEYILIGWLGLGDLVQKMLDESNRLLGLHLLGTRQWLVDKIIALLDGKNNSETAVLHGDAGVGKSVFAAFLA
ncbi:hypothetical protein HK100_005908, partial [Physocladia obscura]